MENEDAHCTQEAVRSWDCMCSGSGFQDLDHFPENEITVNMVLEALTSQILNANLGRSPHQEGFQESMHSGLQVFQMLEGLAMNRQGVRCNFGDNMEEKLAALEQLEKEHKPWQHGFQELLNFPLSQELNIDDSTFAISREFKYDTNMSTGCAQIRSPNHLARTQDVQLFEPESCITHVSESSSPVKTEAKDHNSTSDALEEGVTSATQEPNSSTLTVNSSEPPTVAAAPPSPFTTRTSDVRDRRKRKRSRICKNSEEVESQRMTHIAVERNRRKQMNEHLNVLRSLMPGSYIQRGDQASIIGGAIDFVKELEQLLQSLQAQKRRRECAEGYSPNSPIPFNGFFLSPQYTSYSAQWNSKYNMGDHDSFDPANELIAENKSAVADIEVTMIETHASLKILSQKRPGQLLKTIGALQSLHMTILHLNITTIDQTVLYSFNVKIEDECQLTSADEIATAVHQIFNIIHSNAIN
eukprot:Gb_21105 [translate_table: standard]